MLSRSGFAEELAKKSLSHVDLAIALLYFYREAQEFEERTISDLATDLHDIGFPKPNVTRLRKALRRSRYTVRGKKKDSVQLDLRRVQSLESKYGDLLGIKKIEVQHALLPDDWVAGTSTYLERIVYQINASYESGLYDACAVLCRRLMESLIIETYIRENRHHEIRRDGVFMQLDRLIGYISADPKVALGRNTPKIMREIKQLGDTAAHDRNYVTPQIDLDDLKIRYRRMIQEMLEKAGIRKKT
jgi:hypothetical protein